MNERKDVPYIVFESTIAKDERHIKRLLTVLLTIISLWFLTIMAFIWYITLPVEEVTETQTVEDVDSGTITQSIGDAYGESKAD